MAVLRHVGRSRTTALRNDMLQNPLLSLEAKGLLALMLTFPDGWTYRRSHLVSCSRNSERVFKRVFKELVMAGYVARHKYRTGEGKFDYEYLVSDTPMPYQEWGQFMERGR